jgi:DNA-binding MurR/RpiR family transcriptional regulator
VIEDLTRKLPMLTPELHKAASYVLENRTAISVNSIRSLANAAMVKPNTLVRLARAVGFAGYEEFRKPFQVEVIHGRQTFPHRARWLQSLSKGGKLADLYAVMASDSIHNIQRLFAETSAVAVKAVADEIIRARRTYVLRAGISNGLAENFVYLARMAVENVTAIPQDGAVPLDGLVRAQRGDVLLAMTFDPFRREVVEAVEVARKQGLFIVGISDSPTSPILTHAKHRFVVPTSSPQFLTSTVALSALLETLIAFLIAIAGPEAVDNIEGFHRRRHELGIYWTKRQK